MLLIQSNLLSWLIYNICKFALAELERGVDEEQIKVAYRRLAKFYHPDGLSLIFVA